MQLSRSNNTTDFVNRLITINYRIILMCLVTRTFTRMLYREFGCSQIYLNLSQYLYYFPFYIVNYDDDAYDDNNLTFNLGSLYTLTLFVT